jgi:hypothetical protein
MGRQTASDVADGRCSLIHARERHAQPTAEPVASGIVPAFRLEHAPALERCVELAGLGGALEPKNECGLSQVGIAPEHDDGFGRGRTVTEISLLVAAGEEMPSTIPQGLRTKELIFGVGSSI